VPPSRRDVAFAVFLSIVLAFGVLGVLLLNTSMQQQSRRLAAQHERLSALAQQVQDLRAGLDWRSDPARLARLARSLQLRPADHVRYVETSRGRVQVSERRPGSARARGD
jgi:hypothetical protein